jgi:hypothetical protein
LPPLHARGAIGPPSLAVSAARPRPTRPRVGGSASERTGSAAARVPRNAMSGCTARRSWGDGRQWTFDCSHRPLIAAVGRGRRDQPCRIH